MEPHKTPRSWWCAVGITLAVVVAVAAAGEFFEAAGYGWPQDSGFAHRADNLLRLHVVAHSDRPEDQQVKLAVRDALLKEMARWPLPEERSQMERWVKAREAELASLARQVLARHGQGHEVRVEVGSFPFPEKEWAGIRLPAGEYRAVRVVIGDGAGRNWWCVLFPPLCFVDDEESVPDGAPVALAAPAGDGEDAAYGAASDLAQRQPGGGQEMAEPGEVVWKLRLWEAVSQSAAMDRVKGLVDASIELMRRLSL